MSYGIKEMLVRINREQRLIIEREFPYIGKHDGGYFGGQSTNRPHYTFETPLTPNQVKDLTNRFLELHLEDWEFRSNDWTRRPNPDLDPNPV